MSLTAKDAVDPALGPRSTPAGQSWSRVERSALSGPSPDVAKELLGRLLIHETDEARCVGRIVETEAYAGPADRASHARAGRTARTAVMFGPAGHAYVYLVYGMHHCINVVCGSDGTAAAVLIRALEPLDGLETMRSRRGASAGPDMRMAAGPARLCQALAIDRGHSGTDLTLDTQLYLAEPARDVPTHEIVAGRRIGVEYAGEAWSQRPWRFGLKGHPSLSHSFHSGA